MLGIYNSAVVSCVRSQHGMKRAPAPGDEISQTTNKRPNYRPTLESFTLDAFLPQLDDVLLLVAKMLVEDDAAVGAKAINNLVGTLSFHFI